MLKHHTPPLLACSDVETSRPVYVILCDVVLRAKSAKVGLSTRERPRRESLKEKSGGQWAPYGLWKNVAGLSQGGKDLLTLKRRFRQKTHQASGEENDCMHWKSVHKVKWIDPVGHGTRVKPWGWKLGLHTSTYISGGFYYCGVGNIFPNEVQYRSYRHTVSGVWAEGETLQKAGGICGIPVCERGCRLYSVPPGRNGVRSAGGGGGGNPIEKCRRKWEDTDPPGKIIFCDVAWGWGRLPSIGAGWWVKICIRKRAWVWKVYVICVRIKPFSKSLGWKN